MFRSHLQWRSEKKVDEILTTYTVPEVIEKYFPGGVCGQDKFGRPAFICPAGRADVFGLMRSVSRAQLTLSKCYLIVKIAEEVLPAQTQKMGRPIDQIVVIFDLQHMNRRQLWRPWIKFVIEIVSIFEMNFPELLAVCFVLNAPSFFSVIFTILKPFLSKDTQAKIHILDSNHLDELLKLFNPEDLPAHYGGTMRDPNGDPKCSLQICWGGVVPESYYQLHRSSPGSSAEVADDTFRLVSLARGSKEYFYVGEAKSGDTISWEFYTELNDIAFSLWVEPQSNLNSPMDDTDYRRLGKARGQNGIESSGMTTSFSFNNLLGGQGTENKLNLKQVTQSARVDCDLAPELGNRKVDVSGNYYILFDNSYSWTRAKRIWCKAEVSCTFSPTEISDLNNGPVEDEDTKEEEVDKMVDSELSNVMKAVCTQQYSAFSTLDVNLSTLTMILLSAFPIIRRQFRSHQSTVPSSPQKIKFTRSIKTTD